MARVTTDEHGFARGFSYHDGFLDGVVVNDAGTEAHLAIRSLAGERRVLTLRGLVALKLANFRQGNIISTICILRRDRADDTRHRELTELLGGYPSTGAQVLLLCSSYGAALAAAFDEADISDPGVSLALAR